MNYHEIETCVIRAKAGSQEDLLKLLEKFKPFIIKTAKQFFIRNHDIYDMLQIGYVAIINAVSKYRTGSHTFTCYAFNSIKNAFRMAARKSLGHSEELSLNIQVAEDSDASTEFIDCIKGDTNIEEEVINAEALSKLRKAVSQLPEDELELILMVYYNHIPLKTYAAKKGMSYYLAKKTRTEILEKLRK
jgi:RNA polymerase sporulation-specific sigma factor